MLISVIAMFLFVAGILMLLSSMFSISSNSKLKDNLQRIFIMLSGVIILVTSYMIAH